MSGAVHIDRDVPIPSAGGRGAPKGNKNREIYPWDGMEIGDSFLVPGATQSRLRGTITYQQQQRGWRFTTRSLDEGVRIWRTS